MDCPICSVDLSCIDYFGKVKYAEHYWIYPQSWIEKEGDIYKCNNEDCEGFQEVYHTHGNSNELHDGHP